MEMVSKEKQNQEFEEYRRNIQSSKQSHNYRLNFTQIPQGIKEKLNLPLKGSTYLKKMINTKSQQTTKNNKSISKSIQNSNIIQLNNSNHNNFKRSFSKGDFNKKLNSPDNFSNSGINYYTGNMTMNKNHKYSNDILTNLCPNIRNSRSKSNGRSKNSVNNPMVNLLRNYISKSKIENPATYRKYRTQTKSTDKLYQNTSNYPIHLNVNDDRDYNVYNSEKNNLTSPFNQQENQVNLSKYNDYEYYHNLSINKDRKNNGHSTRNDSSKKMKKSFNVLSDILDSHFTINSPNQPKFTIAENEKNGDPKTNTKYSNAGFKENYNNNNNISVNKIDNLSGTEFYKDRIYQQADDQNTKLTINLSYVGEFPPDRFLEALEHIMTILDPIFERLTFTQKLEKFIENTEDHRRSIRLGSLVGIYIMLKKYEIDDSIKITILEKIISLMQNFEIQEELFLVGCLEIASLFAPCNILLDNMNLISMFLTDFNFPKLQKSAFNCLMLMEYDGIKALVDLASKDFRDYTKYILTNLINTPHIQKSVIIRALINEIYTNHPDKRHAALAALNRMHDLVGEDDILQKIAYFFKDQKIEKIFLASTLRTAGEKGEKILIKELKTNNEFSVRVAIASVFAYRTTKSPNYLDIRLDKNDTFSIAKTLPGSFCTYYGKISPYVYEKILSEQKEENFNLNNTNHKNNHTNSINKNEESDYPYEEYLEVNSRDFLASLQRLISINYNHKNPKLVHKGNYNHIDDLDVTMTKNDSFGKYIDFFKIEKPDNELNLRNSNRQINEMSMSKKSFINKTQELTINNINSNLLSDAVENSRNLISEEVIKALCFCLKDYSSAVRETSANSLAHIGLPEALGAIGTLIECLQDADVVVKSKVIYSIGRIAPGCDNFVIVSLVEALKTNFWKVKLACLNTLAEFGYRASKMALPYLQKLLKESPINKQNISDTIVKLGYEGESVLLKILTSEDDSSYKLKSVIAKSLSYCDINGPNIDFVIETLFRASNSDNPQIRLSAIMAIKSLADKADENITYLKRKNIIPFYYNKLTDRDLSIQTYAIECIKHLGPQGELIFIEGISKDSNPIIRANCAIGLANIGPHTIRTLLIGLHDENKEVRKIVEKEIIGKFAIYDILELFMEKNSQKLSLKIAIRDVLEKCDSLQANTRTYFNDIIMNLDRDIYNTNNHFNYDEMRNIKNDINEYVNTLNNEKDGEINEIENNV